MQFIFRQKPHSQIQSQQQRRTLVGETAAKWVRDRGLDHAVEKEKHLKPLLNLKNLLVSEPSKSAPISIITQKRDSLQIPFRPIDFIRKYPSVFDEFLPGGVGVLPHVRLTGEALNLDAEQHLVYQSDTYKKQTADRLLKLLMISKTNKIPLSIIECLKWDLGLPHNYEKTIVPEFPDYFRVVGGRDEEDGVLELVCWSDELAVSVMEKKGSIAFPMQFSRGFEMDKKVKKWEDEWQKLPYISPYEDASHLLPKSDESDKWAVAVLHELLHILVPKKTERDNLLLLGDYLGLRSRFKRALLQHPGIFYMSTKIGTYTVVLKEGYKRGLLVEDHPWMQMRNRYIHLMNMVKEGGKPAVSVPGGSNEKKKQTGIDEKERAEGDESGEEYEGALSDSSDAEVEDASDDEYDDEDENESRRGVRKNVAENRGRKARKMNLDVKGPSRKSEYDDDEDGNKSQRGVRRNVADNRGRKARQMNLDVRGAYRKSEYNDDEEGNKSQRGFRKNVADNRGRKAWKMNLDVRGLSRRSEYDDDEDGNKSQRGRKDWKMNSDVKGSSRKYEIEREAGKRPRKTKEEVPSRTKMHDGNNALVSSRERSSVPKRRGRSLPDKRTST
ncbi:protein WHAT'S THIS FACTOR 9, mitochondrial isoform X1 [Quercus robur]|uniref:protein WHAT'S THIS FACTOR 9, mitochondrial isoform X1 n=1 Tax=Quercus robur TaxID=38942 RepID=UPI00216242E2|nr:protein WHAT'S THIS FACTOR 9, mitochondrial isoform X1 [Quercus robur]XP_050269198.1 protein WHAT'S THIS FACTOR 9, mitochondrial isoform X1 [Quercus robur]